MLSQGQLVGALSLEKVESQVYGPEEIAIARAVAQLILLLIERDRLQHEWLEARSSELALRETNKLFDEFLSIASHELRTPLTGIKGNIQLARRRAAKAQALLNVEAIHETREKLVSVLECLNLAERRANAQNRMIGDLLDVSRIHAGRLEVITRPTNLVKIAQESVEDQLHEAPDREIKLYVPGCNEAMVMGDADRLAQVLHNYLNNARKYAPADRPIRLRIAKQDGRVRVSVQDEGPGLTPEEQKQVWERFFRVKNMPTVDQSVPGGLGLGLHICRTIIEAHGGTIGLESAPGVGSTFWFELPLANLPLPPA
jgi:signal transduction histidine kinase